MAGTSLLRLFLEAGVVPSAMEYNGHEMLLLMAARHTTIIVLKLESTTPSPFADGS